MKKEIGSLYPLYTNNNLKNMLKNHYYFSLCREALLFIAQNIKVLDKRVMIPAYTCQTVIDPFIQENWDISFYSVNKNLEIDDESFTLLMDTQKPSLILLHPFYGKGLSDSEKKLLKYAKSKGVRILIDITQSINLKIDYDIADFYVGSLRKWYAIPDGAFASFSNDLLSKTPDYNINNDLFSMYQMSAMYLRGLYFLTEDNEIKQYSIKLNKKAENLVSKSEISIHSISDYSKCALESIDINEIKRQRINNFIYLQNNIKNNTHIIKIINDSNMLNSAPLYFPIYTDMREELQKQLAGNSIYCPILWPVEDARVLINDDIKYIYEHILSIPIDQRYDSFDMSRIVNIVNEF